MSRTVILTTVDQPPETLRVFLAGLQGLGEEVWATDDNADPASSLLLREFGCRIFSAPPKTESYQRDEQTHRWTQGLIDRVGAMKDRMLDEVGGYDFAFCVDADLALHPKTLTHLRSLDRPIVTEVFWTRFSASSPLTPQVWDWHPSFVTGPESILRLRTPGVYEVNGYGACTLIRRDVLEAGVRYRNVPGVGFFGEDRHFAIRAAVLGFTAYADTHLPPYHVFRSMDRPIATRWLAAGAPSDYWWEQLDEVWEQRIRVVFHNYVPEEIPRLR